ncbi:unnamed protein product [Diatraea saccharalis]|uniref:Lipase n=1 Tax=Diatraea saccharalis TaxID=40085 RepID=A0A9N9RBE3_9NEOP|nr:unnamed protein product [Diatraea saccharalis]
MASVKARATRLLILLFIFASSSTSSSINTNKTPSIPSDKFLKFIYTTAKNGYLSEEHSVVTEDGYILRMFRIVQAKKCHKEKIQTPVLLMHGLVESADLWIETGPETAGLAYLLSDDCFDVWLGNIRGNYYSRRHVTLDPDKDAAFWKFSADEMGLYDIPAMVDYVLNSTGVNKLHYIGYSQGCTTFFVMCSEKPEYSKKVRVMIALAPASRLLNSKSLIFRFGNYHFAIFQKLYELFGVREVFQKGSAVQQFMEKVCNSHPFPEAFCNFVFSAFDSYHPGSVSKETIAKYFRDIPAGTSVQNLAKYGQSLNSEDFMKFDYGTEENLRIYGQEKPPKYNLKAVNVPIVIIVGRNDGVVDEKDIKWLVGKLPNVIDLVQVEDPLWNHQDVHCSRFFKKLLYQKIYEYLLTYSN